MEPVTTSAMIATVIGYLAKKISDNKSFKDFTSEFSAAVVDWIKPLFLKEDDSPTEVLEKLQQKPDSQGRQNAAGAVIESDLEDNPGIEKLITEMYSVLQEKESRGEAINIVNSKNVVLGKIQAGGNVTIGDNNTNFQDGGKK